MRAFECNWSALSCFWVLFQLNPLQSGSDVIGFLQNKTWFHIHAKFQNFRMGTQTQTVLFRYLSFALQHDSFISFYNWFWMKLEWFLSGFSLESTTKWVGCDRIFTKQEFTPYPFSIRKFWNVGTQTQTVFFHYLSFALHYVSFVNFYEGFWM